MTIERDPDSDKDFTWPWGPWLADGDTLQSAEFFIESGDDTIELHTPSHTDTTATVWIRGGTAGQSTRVTCRVVSTQGRGDDYTELFRHREK